MNPDPHVAALLVASAGAGLLMALAGLEKNVLERKRRRRICPSCGREQRGRACACQ